MDFFEEYFDIQKVGTKPKLDLSSYGDISLNSVQLTKEIGYKYKENYDETTKGTYRILRKRGICAISQVEVPEDRLFKFKWIWDAITGERLDEEDPYGALCFDVLVLVKWFYDRRCNKLWVENSDENEGFYEGYYDDGVGNGDECYIPGRGHHLHFYLLRLPIMDCYKMKGHDEQIITMGPKLNHDEIKEIHTKAKKYSDTYKSIYQRSRFPSLVDIERYYKEAIRPADKFVLPDGLSEKEQINQANMSNREAVENLKGMRG